MPPGANPTPGAASSRPRRLTYDVYTAQGVQQRELPFVLGILADFLGHRTAEPNRRFVTVNSDNFDAVMRALGPELLLRVPNTLSGDDTQIGCELKFTALQDFSPEAIASQIEPLRTLLELRRSLALLRARLNENGRLEVLLGDLLSQPEMLQRVKDQEGL